MRIRVATKPERGTLPPADSLGFGRVFSDHMFRARYEPDLGWHDAAVVPRVKDYIDRYGSVSFRNYGADPPRDAAQRLRDS